MNAQPTTRTILISNDDGYDAPGLAALHQTIRGTFPDCRIVVVAPDRGRRECGHGIIQSRSLKVVETKTDWFHVDGTPADCVRVALMTICPDAKMMFSGVNAGANVGLDLMVSGTVAAAREAAIRGCDAMALSHYRRADVPRTWDHVPRWLQPVMEHWKGHCSRPTGRIHGWGHLWNVNLPAISPTTPKVSVHQCDVDPSVGVTEAELNDGEYRGQIDFHQRARIPNSDVDRCFSGQLTISHLYPGVATVLPEAG